LAPVGFVFSLVRWTDSNSFLVAYAVVAYYFSSKMARLVILLGPVASALAGVALGLACEQLIFFALRDFFDPPTPAIIVEEESAPQPKAKGSKLSATRKIQEQTQEFYVSARVIGKSYYSSYIAIAMRLLTAAALIAVYHPRAMEFYTYSHQLSEQMSQPSYMFKATLRSGESVMVDDYREAYHWLRDKTVNTPSYTYTHTHTHTHTHSYTHTHTHIYTHIYTHTAVRRPRAGVVGLRLPDCRHGQPHHHC
jgi:dolichyl-diphosphooligosaccharide--protein glycosyltransferase